MNILFLGNAQRHAHVIAKLRASQRNAHLFIHDPQRRHSPYLVSPHHPEAYRIAEDLARFAALRGMHFVIVMDDNYDMETLSAALQTRGIGLFNGARWGTGEITAADMPVDSSLPLPILTHQRAESPDEMARLGQEMLADHGAVLCHVGHLTAFQQAYLIRSQRELRLFTKRITEAAAINKRIPSVFLEQPHQGMAYYVFAFHNDHELDGAAFCQAPVPGIGAPCLWDKEHDKHRRDDESLRYRQLPSLYPLPARDTQVLQNRFAKPLFEHVCRMSSAKLNGWFLLRIDWTVEGPKLHSLRQSFSLSDMRFLTEADNRDWLALMLQEHQSQQNPTSSIACRA